MRRTNVQHGQARPRRDWAAVMVEVYAWLAVAAVIGCGVLIGMTL